MAGREVNNLSIPPEAIRTMKKDLAGITRGEWELTLAGIEIEELLKKFLHRKSQIGQKEELEKKKAIEEQKRKEEDDIQKKELEKEEESADAKTAKGKTAEEEEIQKQERRISDEESAATDEIRRRAREREAVVKKQMEKEEDKKSLEQELKNEEELKQKHEEELNKRLQELVQALKKIPNEKIPLQENRTYYLGEQAKILKDLEPILESERKIEENIRFISGIEKTAITPRQKKKAEQERQLAGKERETIEKQRWTHEQKKFNIDKQLKEINLGFQQLAQKEAKLKQEITDVSNGLEKIKKEKEKIDIQKKIKQLGEEKKDYTVAKEKILGKRGEVEEKLAETINKEQKIEKEVGYIESEEKLAEDTDKQRVEKERWKMQKNRSEIEKERWVLEEEVRKIRLEENRINVRYDRILEQENQLRKKIEEINKFLGLSVSTRDSRIENKKVESGRTPHTAIPVTPTTSATPATPTTPALSDEKKSSLEEDSSSSIKKNEKVELGAVERLGYQKPKPIDTKTEEKPKEGPKTEHDEAKEALKKIEEKRGREKLLKKLRAKREKDVEKKENQLLQRIRQGVSPTLSPESPDKTPLKQAVPLMTVSPEAINKKSQTRTLIIVASVIVIALIAGFWYWNAKVRKKPIPTPAPATVDQNAGPIPAIEMPPALITIDTTIPHKIDSLDQILPFATQVFQSSNLSKNKFSRISIEDTEKNKYLGLEESLSALLLTPPQTLYSQLDDNITLYVFPADNYNVLGFVAQNNENIESSDLEQTMLSWETELLEQIRTLGISLGKTNMVPIAEFQENNYTNDIALRYLTLVPGPDCYGACYSIFDNKLFFATCCEPIIKIIESEGIEPINSNQKIEPDAKLEIIENILSWGYRIPSTVRSINSIVIHSSYDAIGQDPYSTDGVIEEYRQYKVAPHYLIARNGTIYYLAPEGAIAYHAGTSEMPDGRKNANDFSIGIELIYTKSDVPNDAQYRSLTLLVKSLREKHNIPLANIVAHDEISPNRENDPANFDWNEFKQSFE